MCLTYNYGMSIGLICSKKKKHLENVRKYWMCMAEMYQDRSDKALETNSQDSVDHSCTPIDPGVAVMSSLPPKHKNKVSIFVLCWSKTWGQ